MDELCEIFGGVELSAQAWESIFTDALSSMTIKLIPPTLDQVLVGSIERSRHPDIKAIFLIGTAQKQFPVPVMGESLLTEQDYQCAANLELANPYEQHLMHRPYLAYIALTRASKQVFLSYPLADEKGAAIVPWSGIEHLTTSFTDLDVQFP
ncbi:MAG: helicase-exonuclease AddAB subunit AddB, partial [Planctomycetota bacterium]